MSTDSKIDDYNYQNMFSASNIAGSYVTTNGTGGSSVTYPWTGTGLNTFYTIDHTYTRNPTTVITENDVVVGGKSLKEFMGKVEERLLILQPDPAKLEKYAALKKAYEHYKLMEKLIQEE